MKKVTISKVMRELGKRSVEKRKADPDKFVEHMRLMTEKAAELKRKSHPERCACGMAWGHTGKHKPVA